MRTCFLVALRHTLIIERRVKHWWNWRKICLTFTRNSQAVLFRVSERFRIKILLASDTTHYLKVGTSVSSRLRFSQREHRLTIAPPAGYYSESDRFYRLCLRGYPSLQYVDSSVYVSVVVGTTFRACPLPIRKCKIFVAIPAI